MLLLRSLVSVDRAFDASTAAAELAHGAPGLQALHIESSPYPSAYTRGHLLSQGETEAC